MNGFRDIEQLSAYLDGQLSPSDSARLESRLKSDSEFASAYDDLRSARGILRKLPSRKAPRNFTLTRKMVGLKPPLPRSYSNFRFATAFATFLFAITIAVNSLTPRLNYAGLIPGYGMGGGGGGGCTGGCGGGPDTVYQLPPVSAAATEAPAAAELAPAPTNDVTISADATSSDRIVETPVAKEPTLESQPQAPVQKEAARIPIAWQAGLLILSLLGAMMLFLMNQSAKRKWQ